MLTLYSKTGRKINGSIRGPCRPLEAGMALVRGDLLRQGLNSEVVSFLGRSRK